MEGKPLFGTPFADLLPASIREVPEIAAAAQTLDAMLYFGDAEIGNVLIWSRIDGLEEPMLSNLAYQLHLEAHEGWHLAHTLEQKRRLVKEAVPLHFRKGTRWSLERTFDLLDMRGLITEWWEAPDDPDLKPYEFDMDMEVARSISEDFYQQLIDLIDELKNLRSHLRRAKIFLTSRNRIPAVASVLISGIFMTIRPFVMEDAHIRVSVPKAAAMYQALHAIEIRPFTVANIAMRAAIVKSATVCRISHEIEAKPFGGNV